jgi:hypothetical protein
MGNSGPMSDPQIDSLWLEQVAGIFHDLAPTFRRRGFAELEAGIDRHGAFEWWLGSVFGAPDRFLVASVTPQEPPTSNPTADYNIWIGADDGRRFTRRLFRHQLVTIESIGPELEQFLSSAIEAVNTLQEDDLDQSRPMRFSNRPEDRTNLPRDSRNGLLTEDVVREYQAELTAEGLAESTVYNYGSQVRRFIQWLNRETR